MRADRCQRSTGILRHTSHAVWRDAAGAVGPLWSLARNRLALTFGRETLSKGASGRLPGQAAPSCVDWCPSGLVPTQGDRF